MYIMSEHYVDIMDLSRTTHNCVKKYSGKSAVLNFFTKGNGKRYRLRMYSK